MSDRTDPPIGVKFDPSESEPTNNGLGQSVPHPFKGNIYYNTHGQGFHAGDNGTLTNNFHAKVMYFGGVFPQYPSSTAENNFPHGHAADHAATFHENIPSRTAQRSATTRQNGSVQENGTPGGYGSKSGPRHKDHALKTEAAKAAQNGIGGRDSIHARVATRSSFEANARSWQLKGDSGSSILHKRTSFYSVGKRRGRHSGKFRTLNSRKRKRP